MNQSARLGCFRCSSNGAERMVLRFPMRAPQPYSRNWTASTSFPRCAATAAASKARPTIDNKTPCLSEFGSDQGARAARRLTAPDPASKDFSHSLLFMNSGGTDLYARSRSVASATSECKASLYAPIALSMSAFSLVRDYIVRDSLRGCLDT